MKKTHTSYNNAGSIYGFIKRYPIVACMTV